MVLGSRIMPFFSLSALLSASHTTYPKTFGTGSRSMPSLARPRTLTPNKWRCRMDLDVQSWKGDGWGVKPLSCKIALAAMLLFQRFMTSRSACFPTSSYLSFSPFLSTHLYTLPYCARADLTPGLRVCRNYKAITDHLVLYAPLQGTIHYNFCLKATPESVKVFHIQT